MNSSNKIQRKAVIYARVSTEEQNLDNQINILKTLCSEQNYNLIHIYEEHVSGGSANRPQFQQMLRDARMRKFDVIYIWSLDRFSREGMNNTLSYIKQLKHHSVALKSLQEGWLDTTEEGMGELLIAIFSWVAKQERMRISERTKAGLERAKANGKKLGRPKGVKDRHPRKKLGYYNRWKK